jgi:hypothetical protein
VCVWVGVWPSGSPPPNQAQVRGCRYGGTCSQAGCSAVQDDDIRSAVQQQQHTSELLSLLPAASLRALRRLTRSRTLVRRGQCTSILASTAIRYRHVLLLRPADRVWPPAAAALRLPYC